MIKDIILIIVTLLLLYIGYKLIKKINFHPTHKCGDIIDNFNNVNVYFNGGINPYGHVAIVSEVNENNITIVQQNAGAFSQTREVYVVNKVNKHFYLKENVLGWLSLRGKINGN